tara:strand:+ start:5181 stop:5903 length:723 start_codon:yes stop_codon:yes gene_type:complete
MLKSAIILIGGKGSRFSDIKSPPKHLAKIRGEEIIIKIINLFRRNNVKEIVFPLGYKKEYYYKFFNSKYKQNKFNFTLTKPKNKNQILIKLFDAGLKTSKLMRISKSLKFLSSEDFIVTYGDGLSDINIKRLIKNYFFFKKKKMFISTFYKNSQYGHVINDSQNLVRKFIEKPLLNNPVNIGYFVFSKKIFKLIYKNTYELEGKFLDILIKRKMLKAYVHNGYFFSIDDKKDLIIAERKV